MRLCMAAKRGQLEKNLERMFKDIEKWVKGHLKIYVEKGFNYI